ncbi:TPA: helix-turn-helix transcriptional regulator [Enterococcus faecium]
MIKKEFNQKTLSKRIGVQQSTLSNFLSNKYSLSPNKAFEISKALDKDFDDLFLIEEKEVTR